MEVSSLAIVLHIPLEVHLIWIECLLLIYDGVDKKSLVRSFICNMKRPSVKQSIKQQVCSNFQMKYSDKLSDIPQPETASDRR